MGSSFQFYFTVGLSFFSVYQQLFYRKVSLFAINTPFFVHSGQSFEIVLSCFTINSLCSDRFFFLLLEFSTDCGAKMVDFKIHRWGLSQVLFCFQIVLVVVGQMVGQIYSRFQNFKVPYNGAEEQVTIKGQEKIKFSEKGMESLCSKFLI